MTEKQKSSRGGARAGAGRPKGDSKLYSFRCPGDMARKIDAQDNKTEFIKNSIKSALKAKEEALSSLGTVIPSGRLKPLSLPYFDQRVVAGFPVPLDNDERSQDIDMLRLLCPHPEATYLIRVSGDSMIDAGIFNGDIVIVDKSNRNPSPREVAVCELNGEFTLKRFVEEDGCGWLVPANPDYPKWKITENDQFSIWGTVTYIIHQARD